MHEQITRADASPTKEFFVHMLTRDISLQDTILDLVDNCLDGVLRTIDEGREHNVNLPYTGFRVSILFSGDRFIIEDNCGGIPYDIAKNEAFRLGRPPSERDKDLRTVGVYGIGMKRALFKIGTEAVVTSRRGESEFEVFIPQNWLSEANDWSFQMRQAKVPTLAVPGTTIVVSALNADVATQFANAAFVNDLSKLISQTYAIFIRKGFLIEVDGFKLDPSEIKLFVPVGDRGISPYALRGQIQGVSVSIACGFYRQLANETEIDDEQESRKRPNEAGWTVICNQRVILYQDRSAVTGWGSSLVPNYHNQFIAFTGVVEFDSPDASKLPLTTTKRGIDVGSSVYLATREYMMRGTKYFTDFTNRWKGNEENTSSYFEESERIFATQANNALENRMISISGTSDLRQATPILPMPEKVVKTRRIVFTKPDEEITKLSDLLFGEQKKAGAVGERCFDYVMSDLS